MQFLYPAFLWGLVAISIPVLVHLFNFRRTKKIYFTNVAFLKAVNTRTSSFRRLKHLLIMAARMLAIACLVLAFAQPYLPAKSGLDLKGHILTSVYIDNSLSMQNKEHTQNNLDRAITKLEELLTVFPQSAIMQLVSNIFGADEYHLANPQQIKERTTSLHFTHTPRSLLQVYQRQTHLAAKHTTQGGTQHIWFSDFQKSTTGDLRKLQVGANDRLFLVPVQAPAVQNVFVDSLWLSTPFVRTMQGNTLVVKLMNTGNNAIQNLSIRLFLDDIQVASSVVNLPANQGATTTFQVTLKDKTFKKGRISFDDTPITFDNDYYFVLQPSPAIQIAHIYSQDVTEPYIKHVFENDSVFQIKSQLANNIDVGQLQTADLLIVEGLPSIDGSLKTALDEFVSGGGSVLVIPSQTPNVASYQAFLGNYGIRNVQQIGNKPSNPQLLAEPPANTGFYADIFDQSLQQKLVQMPSQNALLSWQVAGEKILRFRNDQAFLSVSKAKQGAVYLLASPLSQAWGELSHNAIFVPTMYKIAALSARQEPLAYSFAAHNFRIDLPNMPDKNARFSLKNQQLELLPVQYLVGKQLTIELPKSNELQDNQRVESGYYELMLNGKPQRLLAFNHSHAESQMRFYSTEELKQLVAGQKNIQVFDKLDDAALVKTFKEQYFGQALWKYFLGAALLFLAIEILLIKFYR